jgi:hypothetical protein
MLFALAQGISHNDYFAKGIIDSVYSGGGLKPVKKRLARHQDAIPVGYKLSPLAMPLPRMQMPTSYEIYQSYLRGSAAAIRLFEQGLGT